MDLASSSETFASDGSHLMGGMIALLPTAEDAKRLAVDGGEAVGDLHLTLAFLGGDMSAWTDIQKEELASITGALAALYFDGPLAANIFGVAHWNAGGEDPSWVWNVGDAKPENDMVGWGGLMAAKSLACEALESTHDRPEIPQQHSPWVAHICAAYTGDLTFAKDLEKRLGPVTFDRIRVSFGDEDHDYPLGDSSLTAGAGPQRALTEMEIRSRADFAMIDNQWKSAVADMMRDYVKIENDQRTEIREQIVVAVDRGDFGVLDTLHVSWVETANLLQKHMISYAELAGKEMQREAEHQGVRVPPWDLNSELVAGSARDIISSVARATARNLGLGTLQSATRKAMSFVGSKRSGRDVADEVDRDLKARSTAGPKEQIGSAMTAAQNAGRLSVMSVAPEAVYLASESLDKNTCAACRVIDGTEFSSLSAAHEAYPGGGYVNCAGGGRCRGTMIAVWGRGETASATQEVGMATETEVLGGPPNPGTKKDKRKADNKAMASDVKADDSAAAPSGLEGITLTEDGRIVDADGNEVESFASDCPPGMEFDPGTGECAAPKPGTSATADTLTAAWEGVLVVEGETTGDGREFAPDALTFPEGDITPGEVLLRWNKEDSHGGAPTTKAVAVGRIDQIWKDGNKIMGKGVFDLGQPDGVEAHRRVKAGFLRGVSIDADSVAQADVEFVWPEGGGGSEEDQLMEMLFGQPDKMVYHGGRIRGATLCDIPAFVEAYLKVADESGTLVASAAPADAPAAEVRERPVADRLTTALVAHGGATWKPPAEWFENPQLAVETTIQVTDDGRIYGHAARWGACHIGFTNACVQPPREDDFPYFATGELITDSGKRVPVGQITVTANHADLYAASGPAKEHYENTGNAVADVAVGCDRIGIWVAGAIRPNADPMHVHELRASGEVSGDWRPIGGKLRLVGLLGVNVGGFVVPRMKARVASGADGETEVLALIAAGRLSTAHGQTEAVTRDQAYKIVMDDLYEQMFSDAEGSE